MLSAHLVNITPSSLTSPPYLKGEKARLIHPFLNQEDRPPRSPLPQRGETDLVMKLINRFFSRAVGGCGSSILFFLMLAQPALAATTGLSDAMTSQQISAVANHTITFTTQAGAAEGSTIAISFASSFNTSTISFTDIDFLVGASNRTLAANCAGTEQIGATVASNAITFTICVGDGGAVPASSTITVRVGTNAVFGSAGANRITNPSSAGTYKISILGSFGDRGMIAVVVTSPSGVNVSGTVGTSSSGSGSGGGSSGGGGGTPADTTPPVLSSIQVGSISRTGATVTWTTNESANSFVDYGQTVSYELGTVSSTTLVTSHSIAITGLTQDTNYHIRIRSRDASANEATSTDVVFRTLPPPDTTAPTISDVQVLNITGTGGTIAWTTNESSNSFVDYGRTATYELGTATDATLALDHAVAISGLQSETTYHYRVRSRDGAGNEAASTDRLFTTRDVTAPVIADIAEQNITDAGARIVWTTSESADSSVSYGTTIAYSLGTVTDAVRVTSHSMTLSGLVAATTYHFSIRSSDAAGNSSTSTDRTFITEPDRRPPANVSGFSAVEVVPGNIGLSWTNPSDADLGGVRVVRNTDRVPASPTDGTIIFDGRATSSVDRGRAAGTTNRYVAFAYDTSGNFSSGALAELTTAARCGDNICGFGETSESCAVDCVAPSRSVCGNSLCEAGETPQSCAADCVVPTTTQCGNRICEIGETSANCPADCASSIGAVCGNGVCEAPETQNICPADCAAPPSPGGVGGERQRVSLSDIRVLVANGTIRLLPTDSIFTSIARSVLHVEISANIFIQAVDQIVLHLGSDAYVLARTDGTWNTDVMAPAIGRVPLVISVTYADGTSDRIDATMITIGGGQVITHRDGETFNLDNALVTIRDARGAAWPATSFGQINPVRTGSDGSFYWYVPNGNYTVSAERDGYRTNNTPLTVVSNNVQPTIELVIIPPSIVTTVQNIFSQPTTVFEKAYDVTGAVSQQAHYAYEVTRVEVLDNPVVEKATQQVAAPALATITVVSVGAAATTAIGFVNVARFAQFLFMQPFLFFARRKRKGFGLVYNAITKLPVDLAIVRLKDAATGQILQSRVTDRGGQYFFIVQPGKYLLDANKPPFVFPTAYLKDQKQDALFLDLYHGELIEVTEKDATIAANIPVDPSVEESVPGAVRGRIALRKLEVVVGTISPILALGAVIISPTPLTIGLFSGQIAMYGVMRYLAMPHKLKGWGIVYDATTSQPLARAIVRIFEPIYNKLLETQVTDNQGRYSFLVGPNIYRLTADKAGYEQKKIEGIDYRDKKESALVKEDMRLEPTKPVAPTTPEWKEEPT